VVSSACAVGGRCASKLGGEKHDGVGPSWSEFSLQCSQARVQRGKARGELALGATFVGVGVPTCGVEDGYLWTVVVATEESGGGANQLGVAHGFCALKTRLAGDVGRRICGRVGDAWRGSGGAGGGRRPWSLGKRHRPHWRTCRIRDCISSERIGQ